MSNNPERRIEIFVYGFYNAGKNEIISQFIYGKLIKNIQDISKNDDLIKILNIDNESISVKVTNDYGANYQITGVFPIMELIFKKSFNNPDCYIFVYDATDRLSYERTIEVINRMKSKNETKEIPILILGNRCDLPNKVVQEGIVREFAQRNENMLFYEVSGVTGFNIEIHLNKLFASH